MQLPDDAVQAMLEDIADKGKVHARAEALRVGLREGLKTAEATLMNMAEADGIKSMEKQKRFARSHPTYVDLTKKLQQATEDALNAEIAHKNAEREWESWRTLCANERSIR